MSTWADKTPAEVIADIEGAIAKVQAMPRPLVRKVEVTDEWADGAVFVDGDVVRCNARTFEKITRGLK